MLSRQEHLLICLGEECAEVQKEISKILRFGLNDSPPSKLADENIRPNSDRLSQELTDVQALIRMLMEDGFPIEIRQKDILKKCQKVETYLKYAREKGTTE